MEERVKGYIRVYCMITNETTIQKRPETQRYEHLKFIARPSRMIKTLKVSYKRPWDEGFAFEQTKQAHILWPITQSCGSLVDIIYDLFKLSLLAKQKLRTSYSKYILFRLFVKPIIIVII